MDAHRTLSSDSDAVRLSDEPDFTLGDLAVHPSLREVIVGGARRQVEPRVMQVLVVLAGANGGVVSRDELIRRCWDGRVVGEAAINRCIFKLRELADAGARNASFRIETIARVGYRLETSHVVASTPAIVARPPLRSRAAPRLMFLALVILAVFGAAVWLALRVAPSAAPKVAVDASIAVLPFKNLSSEPDAAYFAAGIQDEILTRLAKIGSLKVISRTSAEQVAAKPGSLRDMAHALGVANIVEGSVQRGGDTVRVNVQLIRVDDDEHLWAEDYDRKLDDMLSVENEVAGAIAGALAAKITPSESTELATHSTLDRRAYDAYLRGLVLQRQNDVSGNFAAVAALEQAVAADPSFAVAWALLARAHANLAFQNDRRADHAVAARAALDRALALAPDLVEVQLADATYKYDIERDFAGAGRAFQAVHARWPNNIDALHALGLINRRLGHWAEAATYLREVITRDPLVPVYHAELSSTFAYRRDQAAAIEVLDTALAIWPDDTLLQESKIEFLQNTGALDRADTALAAFHLSPEEDDDVWPRRVQFAYRRQFAEGLRYFEVLRASPLLVARTPEQRASVELVLGDFRARNGDTAGARQSYQAAIDLLQPSLKEQPDDTRLLTSIAGAYAGLGDKAATIRYADRVVELRPYAKDAIDGFDAEVRRAIGLSRLGERDSAIAALQKIMAEPGSLTTTMLRLEPDFDPLRADPRFQQLVAGETPVKNE